MSFETYKPDQAKASRTIILVIGLVLLLWGCSSLNLALPRVWQEVFNRSWNEFSTFGGALPSEAWRLDLVVFETKFGPAFTLAALVALGSCFWWWRFMNKPKWADLLIDMETELKKVSWPTPGDAWESTLVVTGFTVALIATIFVYDIVIRTFLELVAGA